MRVRFVGSHPAGGPPQPGGTLRYGLSQAPTCSDPAQAGTNQTIYVTRQMVDSLTDQNPDTGEITPWLAESWEVSADATSFTFELRDGVTFSDGTPVTASSVKNNFDAIVHSIGGVKAPSAVSYLSGYTGTTVVDAHTAQVNFSAPNAQFLQATSTPQLGMLSDKDAAKSAEERCPGPISATGTVLYADYQQDQSVTLAKRAGYNWGSEAFAHDGEAYLDRIEFTDRPRIRCADRQSLARASSTRSRRAAAGRPADRGGRRTESSRRRIPEFLRYSSPTSLAACSPIPRSAHGARSGDQPAGTRRHRSRTRLQAGDEHAGHGHPRLRRARRRDVRPGEGAIAFSTRPVGFPAPTASARRTGRS